MGDTKVIPAEKHNETRRRVKANQKRNKSHTKDPRFGNVPPLFGTTNAQSRPKRAPKALVQKIQLPREEAIMTEAITKTIADKTWTAVLKVIEKEQWLESERDAALAYVCVLTVGGNASAAINRLPNRQRQQIEQRFAFTCWFQQRILGDTILPGMKHEWYKKLYAKAMELYPSNMQRKAS